MPQSKRLEGQCLCGTVRISIKPAALHVGACHCSRCRRWGGGPLLGVECDADVQIEGYANVSVYDSSSWAERGFCRRCGTHLFYRLKQGSYHVIPVGLFDDKTAWKFDHQIFIDEKPSFYSFAEKTKNLTRTEVFALLASSTE